jgi:predicted RNase H-like HicB family nuclease
MAPELPACGVLGADSEQEVISLMRDAIAEYLRDLKAKGQTIPTSEVKIIQVTTA